MKGPVAEPVILGRRVFLVLAHRTHNGRRGPTRGREVSDNERLVRVLTPEGNRTRAMIVTCATLTICVS
jgi:hypothetical protein